MGKSTLARQRAQGLINKGRVDKLYDAGLMIIFADEYDKLVARVAELERRNKLLRDVAVEGADDIAARVLKEAMTR